MTTRNHWGHWNDKTLTLGFLKWNGLDHPNGQLRTIWMMKTLGNTNVKLSHWSRKFPSSRLAQFVLPLSMEMFLYLEMKTLKKSLRNWNWSNLNWITSKMNILTEQEVIDGMQTEMKSMKSFDVYDEIPIEHCSQEDIDNALDGTWVKRRKTATKVRCRLCVRGCFQETMDQDDVFASTPTLVTLRVLLLMTLSRCWTAMTCDISAAFLHAPMTDRILMKPPSESYPTGNCLWLLKRAMYGLKQAPALWQTHFAKVMTELGFHRCKTDSNLYCHKSTELLRTVLCRRLTGLWNSWKDKRVHWQIVTRSTAKGWRWTETSNFCELPRSNTETQW